MVGGIVLKCAASGARLPWVQMLSLSLQLHELEHVTFLFLSFLILKMGTIIVLASWVLIKLLPPSPAPGTSYSVWKTSPKVGKRLRQGPHNDFEAEVGQKPRTPRAASRQRPHTTALFCCFCSPLCSRRALQTCMARSLAIFSISQCSWRRAEKEFSSLRHSYFRSFFSLCTLSSWLACSVASPLPFSPSLVPSGNSKPSEWISINRSSNSLLQGGEDGKLSLKGEFL